MPSFISSWEKSQIWLTGTVEGNIILTVTITFIFYLFRAVWRIIRPYFEGRRSDRFRADPLEVLEPRRAYRLAVLKSRLKYFQTIKERPGRHLATLNVYGFLFLTFLVIRVGSSDLKLSNSDILFVSIIMFSAFVIFAKTGFLLMNLNYFIKKMQRKITEFKEPDEEL